jgi:hypothetical protein
MQAARDPRQIAGATLLEKEGQEDDLKEQVTELPGELLVISGLGCVGDLVGLLDGVRDYRPYGLRAIPRAVLT